jgi:predicted nuclease of predicted toxin-antitoxin system
LRFLVDAQLPPTLAHWLVERGHEAEHVFDVGLAAAEDIAIWRKAVDEGRILVTKDRDFEELATRYPAGGQVVWLRVGNVGRRALIGWLEPRWPRVEASLAAGERIVEVW